MKESWALFLHEGEQGMCIYMHEIAGESKLQQQQQKNYGSSDKQVPLHTADMKTFYIYIRPSMYLSLFLRK
jgi:hypothetical protein